MKILSVEQGTPRWLEVRKGYFCASEAPAMMGLSPYMTRDELLRSKKTGWQKPQGFQKHLRDGHEAERLTRAAAESYLDADLFPATIVSVVEGMDFLSSFDGIDISGEKIWENKNRNSALIVTMKTTDDVPDAYWPQLEHQLLTVGKNMLLFTSSDGVGDPEWLVYKSRPERRQAIIDGWKLFADDLATYDPKMPEPTAQAPVVADICGFSDQLVVHSRGDVYVAGIETLREQARLFLDEEVSKPQTDSDLALAEQMVVACKKAENRITLAIDNVFDGITGARAAQDDLMDIHKSLRDARLRMDKKVKAGKAKIRNDLVDAAMNRIRELKSELKSGAPDGIAYPEIAVDFQGAMKNKKTREGLKNAIDAEMVRAMISVRQEYAKAIAEHVPRETPSSILDDRDAVVALKMLISKGYSIDEIILAYEKLGE